jgi:hypothetical protein
MDRHRASVLARALVFAGAFAPCLAAAEGLSLYLEPDYSHVYTRSTDQQGRTTSSTTDELAQHYRLSLDKTLWPYVRVDAFGLFEKTNDWIKTDGVYSKADEWRAGGSAHLRLGPPVLGGDLGYDRRDDSVGNSLTTVRQHTVNEIYSAHAGWRPAEAPSIDLRLSRTNSYDVDRRLADFTNDEALLATEYAVYRQLRAGYFVDYQRGTDRLSGTVTSSLLNSARATYSDTYNLGRTSVLASYQFNNRLSDTTVSGVGGNVATPQVPLAGLSLIEPVTVVAESDALVANPALIDGDLLNGAAVGVNIGFSVTQSGDNRPRDLGLQFADPSTAVNTLYVWVDKTLPADVVRNFSWAAYKSDDNQTWIPVNIVPNPSSTTGPVLFSPFQNRFEITIERTPARYIKVVTKPLPFAVTADRRFSDVLVTELQAFLVVPAAAVRGSSSTTSQTATGTFHQRLLDDPNVAYDFSGILTLGSGGTAYTVQNALSLDQRLSRVFLLNARAARQDTGQSSPGRSEQHNGLFQYSGSLTATPLPTLTDALTYTGQYVQTPSGTAKLNSVTFINRAQIYRGLDALGSVGYNYNFLDTGAVARGPTVLATLTLVPNSVLTLSGTYYLANIRQTGGRLPDQENDNERIDGSATLSPFQALYLSMTVSRIIKGTRPTTLLTAGGSFSPFPDGTVLLRATYSESLDTASQLKNGSGSVGVRWNLVPGSYLDVGYTLLRSSSDIGSSDTRALTASLVLQL